MVLTAAQARLLDRHNQVHFYVRQIQSEQLLEQDLTADVKAMAEEGEFGRSLWASPAKAGAHA